MIVPCERPCAPDNIGASDARFVKWSIHVPGSF
jgi:hypothetical protein